MELQPTPGDGNHIIHCSYCHKHLAPSEAKKCGKCHRRRYYGKQCQEFDWMSRRSMSPGDAAGLVGQGHKDWCGLPVLEEDVHWAIIARGSAGLMAKVLIPPLTRIMVEGNSMSTDGLFQNLGDERGRISFSKHACDANAHRMQDTYFKAMVIYSKREIRPGEEIYINYLDFPDVALLSPIYGCMPNVTTDRSDNYRRVLLATWGIDCVRKDCFCRKEGLESLVLDFRQIFVSLMSTRQRQNWQLAKTKADCIEQHENNMTRVQQLFQILETLNVNAIVKAKVLEVAFDVAARSSLTLEAAKDYIKQSADIWNAIINPKSPIVKDGSAAHLKDPASYEEYLCIDKKWGPPS